MTMPTLEDLLAGDGFKRERDKLLTRREVSAASIAASSSNPRRGFSGAKPYPARTRSDVNPRRSLPMMPEIGGFTEPMSGNALARRFGFVNSNKEQLPEVQVRESKFIRYLKESKESEGTSNENRWRFFPIEKAAMNFKSRRVIEPMDGYSKYLPRELGFIRSYKNELYEDDEQKGERSQNFLKPNFKDVRDKFPAPSLDEATLKAVFLMINSCISDLLEDESFRLSVNRSCISSLNSCRMKDSQPSGNGVHTDLKEAIGAVERIITEGFTKSELKETSLKLSVFTGLKSMESDDIYFCGNSLSHFAACAHLYLSILNKIQKKDSVSAKHLLQVFFHSPYQARTALLPGLWESLFWPHLSHLKAWHGREVESIQGTSGMKTKLEFLKKIYNDLLDLGTSKFAAFFKGCLMEDYTSPALTSVLISFESFPEVPADDYEIVSSKSSSSSDSVPSKPMISKIPSESVLTENKITQTTFGMKSGGEEKVEMEYVIEEKQPDVGRQNQVKMQKDEETSNQSRYLGSHSLESFQEYYSAVSNDLGASFDIMQETDQTNKNSCGSSSSSFPEVVEINHGSEMAPSWHDVKEHIHVNKCDLLDNENELKMKKLPQASFELQITDHYNDANTNSPKQFFSLPVYTSYEDKMIDVTSTKFVMDKTSSVNRLSYLYSSEESSSANLLGYHKDIHEGSLSGIPKDFICPLTGLLLKDPVTLESGYNFELAAIKERFNQGNRTCPITGHSLKCSTIPDTNIVFKQKINEWVAEFFRTSLSCASQSCISPAKQVSFAKYELALVIIEQLLNAFSSGEEKENIRHLVSLGGLQLLTQILELGSLENKSRAAGLLAQFIRADGCCWNYLPMEIGKPYLLELLLSKQVQSRTNAAALLIELFCLDRRLDITSFVYGLRSEIIDSIKHELLVCLQHSQPEDRVLVAVLLLHIDLMQESQGQGFSFYRRKAVKCIVETLECCLSNKKFIANCQRALLMLGAHFSFSRENSIETWLLKQYGFNFYSSSYDEEGDQAITEEEASKREDWLKNNALVLLVHGNKLFLKTLSNCWKSGSPDLVWVCLSTTSWLSHALASISIPALSLSTFLALMPRLKESLNNVADIKQRALASFCLLNFSKISECRFPLMAYSDQIYDSLKSLREVTWTAKHLYSEIFQ